MNESGGMAGGGGDLRVADLDRGRLHLIEANAGTGKTYAIANLFLRFILEAPEACGTEVRARNILVVTFTRAATDELRGRLRARLEEARNLLSSGEVVEGADEFFAGLLDLYPKGEKREHAIWRLELALRSIHEAPINTIHGFCQQALSDQAFSSGEPFELEQADDAQLRQSALQDWWRRRTYDTSPEELEAFLDLIPSLKALRDLTRVLLRAAPPELNPAPPSEEELARREQSLTQELARLAALWRSEGSQARRLLVEHKGLSRNKSLGYRLDKLEPLLEQLDDSLQTQPPSLPPRKALEIICYDRLLSSFKPTGEGQEDFDRELYHQAQRVLERSVETRRLRKVRELRDACAFVRSRVREVKERKGLISFDDMIERLHRALHGEDGERADALARRLAHRYPIVMIDEFQDTDRLQYGIFWRIHSACPDHTLVMIGDPKQAIYAFRGGDIFTYLTARASAQSGNNRLWTLKTNWRSTAQMIDAVNELFEAPNAFTFGDDIPYFSSRPAPEGLRAALPLLVDGQEVPALIVQDLPSKENGKLLNKSEAHEHVREAVAERIAQLLAPGRAYIGSEPLEARHIAVLVRTAWQARDVRESLLRHGVRSVAVGNEQVWASEEANGLRLVLEAALLPEDRKLARQALSASFLGLDATALQALVTDPQRWGAWVELLSQVGQRWRKRGFMPAFHTLLHGLVPVLSPASPRDRRQYDPTAWLARLPDPERTLTNLLQLSELLQEASREHAGGELLLAWMRRQQEATENEEHVLRLESDEGLVKIATMHSSKGLQFPVVFAPYLWRCRPAKVKPSKEGNAGDDCVRWHERGRDGFRHYYRPWLDEGDKALVSADHERLAEDVRLVYVALTRARSHCHVFFGPSGSGEGHAGQTAMAWLLSDRQVDLDEERFSLQAQDVTLEPLEDRRHIAVWPPGEEDVRTKVSLPAIAPEELEAGTIDRSVRSDWKIASFTALTRDVHQVTHVPAELEGEDFALAYPAGASVGSFLHAMLERMELDKPLPDQVQKLSPHMALRYGLDTEQDLDGLTRWLEDIVHTDLDGSGLTLAGLDHRRTLHEAEFDFATARVDIEALDSRLRERAVHDVPAIGPVTFQGMVTGIIDLVFEHQGHYYVADYKSNLLGRSLGDYTPERLGREVEMRRYDLQYLLYTLALHRHLRLRVEGYDYARHFGGVFYLFLRGMRPLTGPQRGVFFVHPEQELIELLDHDFFALPPEDQP